MQMNPGSMQELVLYDFYLTLQLEMHSFLFCVLIQEVGRGECSPEGHSSSCLQQVSNDVFAHHGALRYLMSHEG